MSQPIAGNTEEWTMARKNQFLFSGTKPACCNFHLTTTDLVCVLPDKPNQKGKICVNVRIDHRFDTCVTLTDAI